MEGSTEGHLLVQGRGIEGWELGEGDGDGVVPTGEGNWFGAKGNGEGIRGVLGHGDGEKRGRGGGLEARRATAVGAGGGKGQGSCRNLVATQPKLIKIKNGRAGGVLQRRRCAGSGEENGPVGG
eukprot:scaffold681_cov99-Amphora_coffeaeformis.AAC.1